MKDYKKFFFAIGSIIAAIAASSCCALPLLFFILGISGAWIGKLTALHPYKPWFILLSLGLLFSGLIKVYRKPKKGCIVGNSCDSLSSNRLIKIALWLAAMLIGISLIFPYFLHCSS